VVPQACCDRTTTDLVVAETPFSRNLSAQNQQKESGPSSSSWRFRPQQIERRPLGYDAARP
jgi:hypothetical protein